jgi:outer membrane murein-binding lipoprotein Lpp
MAEHQEHDDEGAPAHESSMVQMASDMDDLRADLQAAYDEIAQVRAASLRARMGAAR